MPDMTNIAIYNAARPVQTEFRTYTFKDIIYKYTKEKKNIYIYVYASTCICYEIRLYIYICGCKKLP